MAANVWPVDAVGGLPEYTGRELRQLTGLPWGRNPARPLGARSGVVAGTPDTIGTATTSTWTVTPFGGTIDGESSAIAGTYNFTFDSNQTGSVTTHHATLDRIDLVYVRVSDPAEGDGSTDPTVETLYLAGTAASSPSPPATPARSFPLLNISVPHSGGAPAVSFVAPWAVAAGGIVPAADSTGYPASPYVGQYADDAVLGLRRYDGSSWTAPNGDTGWESSGLPGIGGGISNFILGYTWRVLNGVMYLNLLVERSNSTLTFPSNGHLTDTPFATISGDYAPTTGVIASNYVSSGCEGGCLWNGTNFVITDGHPTATIAPGDVVKASFIYPLG